MAGGVRVFFELARVFRTSLSLAVVASASLTLGCGSQPPRAEGGPKLYESVETFALPSFGASPGGLDGKGEDHPTNNPSYGPFFARTATVVGQHLVVLPPPRRSEGQHPHFEAPGLLVYALTDPLAPALVGKLDLPGWPQQMLADESALTLVLRAPRNLDQRTIPESVLSDQHSLLLRVDLSDPEKPVKAGELELSEGFWQLSKFAGHDFVISTQSRDREPCDDETSLASLVESLSVTSYGFSGRGLSQVQRVDLPFDGYVAFATSGGFVAVDDNYGTSPHISAARFGEDGALTQTAPVAVDGEVRAVAEAANVLAVVTADAEGAAITTFGFTDSNQLTKLGSAELASGDAGYSLKAATVLGEQVLLGQGYVVRLEGSGAPRVVAAAPGSRLFPAGDRLLSASVDENAQLTLTLLALAADDRVTQLAQVRTQWPAANWESWDYAGLSWDEAARRLVYVVPVFDEQAPSGTSTHLGVATVEADAIAVTASRLETSGETVISAQAAYLVGENELQAASISAEPSTGDSVPFWAEAQPLSELELDGKLAGIIRRGDDVFVTLSRPDSAPLEFQLPHFADELLATGDYLLAAGLRQIPECERFAAELPAELEVECPTPRARGLTFIDWRADQPEAKTLLIDNQLDAVELPADSEQWTTWTGLIRVGDERLIFPVARVIQCGSEASCAELGMPAYKSYGTPGCESPPCDADSQRPFERISGIGNQSLLYTIDLTETPDLSAPLVLAPSQGRQHRFDFQSEELATSLDRGAEVLRSGDTIGFPTRDPVYNERGNSVSDANGFSLTRFGVELVRVVDGQLELSGSISTPGRAVALADDASKLLSVEPRVLDAEHIVAVVHRSALRNGGAHVEQTVELGSGFEDAIQQGSRAYFLTGLNDYCAADPMSQLSYVELDAAELATSAPLVLPFGWGLVRTPESVTAGNVLLNGGPIGYRGRAEIDASGQSLRVLRYYSVPPF